MIDRLPWPDRDDGKPLPGPRQRKARHGRAQRSTASRSAPLTGLAACQGLTGQRCCFEGTCAPGVVRVNCDGIDFSAGGPQRKRKVGKMTFDLNGEVTGLFQPVGPLIVGRNRQ
jgi:hypothetical protein